VGLKQPDIRIEANQRSNSHRQGWEQSQLLPDLLFSEKQQISKGEYKHTQQPTFTRGMEKSDIMHGIYELMIFCRNNNILCMVVL
jgi:hypothetical protein